MKHVAKQSKNIPWYQSGRASRVKLKKPKILETQRVVMHQAQFESFFVVFIFNHVYPEDPESIWPVPAVAYV